MEITKANFKEVLPKVQKAISESTFLSIDCELTGLNLTHNVNCYDTPEQYYQKAKTNSKDFLVIQFGLAAFRFDNESKSFKQNSFNFYIFRRPINRNIPDQRFLCQTSSIDFLIGQNFDFNKLFKEGISYLNNAEEVKYRENLEERLKMRQNKARTDNIPIPENMQSFIQDVIKQIEDFLKGDKEEIQLPKCSPFHRKLIYQETEKNFANSVSLESRVLDNKVRVLFATRLKSTEELEELEKKFEEEQMKELDEFIGFTKVVKMIVESQKLVIGHNICLDLLHTIDKFLTPLPEDYKEFKDCTQSLFPSILDTKYISSSEPFKELITSTVLKDLLETCLKPPFSPPQIEIETDGNGYNLKDCKEHEAGYDAFITGTSFISLWKYLGSQKSLSDEETFSNLSLLENYLNKVFLMTLTDNQYINLSGPDLTPSRDHVFYLTFPKQWKLNNIIQLFSPFGNAHIAWIDDCSAYVGLYKKDQAKVAFNTLSQSDTYSIKKFKDRQIELGLAQPTSKEPKGGVKRKRNNQSSSKNITEKQDDGQGEWQTVPVKRTRKKAKTFDEGDWDTSVI